MLDNHTRNLSQIEFYMIITKEYPLLDIYQISASFIPIARQYPNWDMMIDQWTMYKHNDSKYKEFDCFVMRNNLSRN